MNTNLQHNQPKNKIIEISSMHKFFVLSNINLNSGIKSSISTLWCPNSPFSINMLQLAISLRALDIKNIIIMNISEKDKTESSRIQSNEYLKVNIQQFKNFISRDDIKEYLPVTLFITDDIP